jgi:hypothetical protein
VKPISIINIPTTGATLRLPLNLHPFRPLSDLIFLLYALLRHHLILLPPLLPLLLHLPSPLIELFRAARTIRRSHAADIILVCPGDDLPGLILNVCEGGDTDYTSGQQLGFRWAKDGGLKGGTYRYSSVLRGRLSSGFRAFCRWLLQLFHGLGVV